MLARTAPRPEPRELRACALAALAEAGIVALPAHLILTESGAAEVGAATLVPAFMGAYVLGAVLTCRFRGGAAVTTATAFVAAIVAALTGVVAGGGDLNRAVFAATIALVVAFRIVTLGVRDWRTPLHAEIGWFGVALGLETAIASGPEPGWRPLLVVVVPLFFVASLASRASTVWTGGGVHDLDDRVRRAWIRRAVVATAGLVAVMAVAVALSVRGGLFDRLGTALTPAVDRFASFVGWLLGQAARPFFWLVDRIGIDPRAVRELLERLREGGLGDRVREQTARPEAALWQRLLGLAVFLLVGYAIFRAIRRLRPSLGADGRPPAALISSERPLLDAPPTSAPARTRHELPADAVRRWYAEALIALRRRAIEKPPSSTPAEFVRDVAPAYPSVAGDFERLTHAYEDVRYGSLRLGRAELDDLRRHASTFARAVAGASPLRPSVGDDRNDT